MTRLDEAHTAIANQVRALKAACPLETLHPDAPVRPLFAQLYAALAALDAVGDGEPDALRGPASVEGEDACGRCADRGCWCWTGAIPLGPGSHQEGRTAALAAETVNRTAGGPADRTAPDFARDLPTCATVGCWRAADLPSGLCHHCSEHGQAPLPFERARRREGVFGGGEEA